MIMSNKKDIKTLLEVGDGPEGIAIYTSEDEGIVDWSSTEPTVYIEICNNETYFRVRLTMQKTVDELLKALSK